MSLSSADLERATEKLSSMMENSDKLVLKNGALEEEDLCALTTILVCQSYPNVSTLNLKNNGLTDKQVATLVAALNYDESILCLDLSENELSQRAVYHLLMCLSSFNETLKELSLANNSNICNTGVRYIAEIIENNTSIVKLNLSGIDLERRADVLGVACKKNSTLKELNLQSTSLYTVPCHLFIQALAEHDSCTKLEELNLNYNPFEGGNFEIYLPLFTSEKLVTLKVLHLSFNQLMFNSNKFSEVIAAGLSENTTLEKLFLQGNLFNLKDCVHFARFLSQEEGIPELDLAENCICLEGARMFHAEMGKNRWMKNLNLKDNRFQQEKGGKKIEKDIEELLQRNRGERVQEVVPKRMKRDSPAFAPPLRSQSLDTASIKNAASIATRGESLIIESSEDVFVGLDEDLRQKLKNLAAEFPQALPKPKAERRRLRRAKLNKQKVRQQQEQQRIGAVTALSNSMIDLQVINKTLGRSTRMVSVVDQVQSNLEGYSAFLPGEMMKEVCSEQKLLPGVGMMEMLVHGMKIINVVLWAVVQSFTGYQESDKRVCSRIIKKFFENTEEKDLSKFSGVKVLNRLCAEIADCLLLVKPVFALGEALLLVMTSEVAAQPSLSYYERRDAKYEKRAQRHIDRKLKKVERIIKKENLKRALLRAKETIKRKDSHKSKGGKEGDGPLTKALRGVQMVQQLEQMRKAQSTSGMSVVTKSTKKDLVEVPEETQRIRENCPERVDDLLDDLKSNTGVLAQMLELTPFFKLMHVFVGTDRLKTHIRSRVTALEKTYPDWFSDLEEEFRCQELTHLKEEILKDISKAHGTLCDSLQVRVREIPFTDSIAGEILQHKLRKPSTLSFVKQLEQKLNDSDAAGLKEKLITKLQTLSTQACNETVSKKTINLKAQFEM